MLDKIIINQIIEKKKKERRDSGRQPVPLYDELELPPDAPSDHEEPTEKPIKIDIWGPQDDKNIVDNNILNFYSQRKYI